MKIEARKFMRVPVAALLVSGALGVSLPAVANDEQPTASFQISDLNLSTARGQHKLERRTAAAIEQVCPARGSAASPRARAGADHRECAQSVRQSVKLQLGESGSRPVVGR